MKTADHSSKADRCEEKQNVVLISVAAALSSPYGSVSSHRNGSTVTPSVHADLRLYRKHSTQPY